MASDERQIDELLENAWIMEEAGEPILRRTVVENGEEPATAQQALQDALAEGLLEAEDERVRFTEAGRARAEKIIRRHRLAERLLRDVIEVREKEWESGACQFEHMLSEEVVDNICTLLGHPPICPHGRPIPRGECCRRAAREIHSVVVPLTELEPNARARVAYVATRHHERLDRLAAMGLLPGTELRLHQKRPSYVVIIGETQLAFDEEVARDIYVRKLGEALQSMLPPCPGGRWRWRWGWRHGGPFP